MIGQETLRFSVSGRDLTVTIDVTAALHALGIRVYRYGHHAEERWHDGQMVSLVTRTDDDGIPRKVDASRDPATGLWHGVTGVAPGPAPPRSTSVGYSQTVGPSRLLDRETGAVFPVRDGAGTEQALQIGQHQVATTKFDLSGVIAGSVWYDGNGCWVQGLYHTRVDGSLIELRVHN